MGLNEYITRGYGTLVYHALRLDGTRRSSKRSSHRTYFLFEIRPLSTSNTSKTPHAPIQLITTEHARKNIYCLLEKNPSFSPCQQVNNNTTNINYYTNYYFIYQDFNTKGRIQSIPFVVSSFKSFLFQNLA
jgi:hypothetical protein